MLIPDNIQPDNTIYYIGSLIIKILKNNHSKLNIIDLYQKLKQYTNTSFLLYIFCLDWLFLVDIVFIDKKGVAKICLLKN